MNREIPTSATGDKKRPVGGPGHAGKSRFVVTKYSPPSFPSGLAGDEAETDENDSRIGSTQRLIEHLEKALALPDELKD
jgi:hypothetical protein